MADQTVTPMIAYEDGFAALDWLSRVCGFRELTRMTSREGQLAHGPRTSRVTAGCSCNAERTS